MAGGAARAKTRPTTPTGHPATGGGITAQPPLPPAVAREASPPLRQDRSAAYTPSPQRGTNVCGI